MKRQLESRARRQASTGAKRRLAVLGLILTLPWWQVGAAAQEATPPETEPAPLKPLSVPLPVGQESRGIKIPQFNLTGQVLSQLLAGKVLRVDEEFLQIKELKLDFFDDGGNNEFRIDMPVSLFSTKTRVITSEEPVFIHHRDFDLTGAKLEFNTATRKGRLIGPVTMKIRDLDKVSGKDSPAAPTATPSK